MFDSNSWNKSSESSSMRGNDQADRNLFQAAYSGLTVLSDFQSLNKSQAAATESMQLPNFEITGATENAKAWQQPNSMFNPGTSASAKEISQPNQANSNGSLDQSSAQSGSGWMAVAGDLGKGAWQELTQHPDRVLENVAIGAAIAGATALAAPEVAVVASSAALAYAGYEVLQNGGQWMSDANIVANGDKSNPQALASANQGLEGMGAAGTDTAAGAVGGLITGSADAAITSAIKRSATEGAGANATELESIMPNSSNETRSS